MDRFIRINALHHILSSHCYPVSLNFIQDHLECSSATAKRCIADMRNYLDAPIEYYPDHRGYAYREDDGRYELPGLWFTPAEIQALALLDQLLREMTPGLLRSHLEPFAQRLEHLLRKEAPTGTAELRHRLRILPIGGRRVAENTFARVTEALLQRRQLQITYHARSRAESSERVISPQRLVHYRDNWFLDAWCHTREGLRTFALDRLTPIAVTAGAAEEVPEDQLEAHFAGAYGIFAGYAHSKARLRFSPRAARWVAEEQWHPAQQGRWQDNGHYELILPYGDPTELIMDILRHGPDCEVLAPLELRQAVSKRLRQASDVYK